MNKLTRNFVITKTNKVINSCKSTEQLTIAYKYCSMLTEKWFKERPTDLRYGDYRLLISFLNDKIYSKRQKLNENS
jgi:hypothetical protein